MPKTFKLPTLPYPCDVIVSTDDAKRVAKFVHSQMVKPSVSVQYLTDLFGTHSDNSVASTYTLTGGYVIIIFRKKPNILTVTHEALHAVFSTLRFAGVELAAVDEEVFAYLHQFIVYQITKELKASVVYPPSLIK